CVFVGCDLSNVRFRGASLRSVTFKDCKMMGVFWDSLGSDPMVGFTDCAMRYQAFANLSLRSTPFTRCSLVEASFAEVDLTRATFTDCDLTRTTFDRCTLTSADFTTSTGVVFDAAKNRSKGAKISAETAAAMAAALGLIVAGHTPSKR
ncbi:MAG: pentapeptide repeat-containing protein, partial [Myxococcales bacterium]